MKKTLRTLEFAGIAVLKPKTSVRKLSIVIFLSLYNPSIGAAEECVILLHGLARISNSMSELATKISQENFFVANINYPSLRYGIESLAEDVVGSGIDTCIESDAGKIHFVTHSLGGILVRYYFLENELSLMGRVVMLGPPNQGTQLVDKLEFFPGFGLLGPAGLALGTKNKSILNQLGPVDFELGIIAGTVSINPLSFFMLESPNDGVVSVESTKVDGMKAHITLPVTHSFMMRNNEVIDHAISFLRSGYFLSN